MTDLDKDTFDAAVLAHKGVYLVDFWSETCETCAAMMPEIETLERELAGKVTIGAYLDDSAITAKVKSSFMADREVSALDIKVETNNGVVQLSGFADSRQEIDKAIKLARDIQGVKSVENNIQLKRMKGPA